MLDNVLSLEQKAILEGVGQMVEEHGYEVTWNKLVSRQLLVKKPLPIDDDALFEIFFGFSGGDLRVVVRYCTMTEANAAMDITIGDVILDIVNPNLIDQVLYVISNPIKAVHRQELLIELGRLRGMS